MPGQSPSFSGHIPDCIFTPLHRKERQKWEAWGQPLLEKGYHERRRVLSLSTSPLEEPVLSPHPPLGHGSEQAEKEVDVLLLPMSH